jgi:fucose permease
MPSAASSSLLRARIATSGFFVINAIVGFSFLPRLAEIQSKAGLNDAGLGVVLAVGTAGGLVIGPLAGVLVQRWGAVPIAGIMGLATLPGLIAVGFATNGVALAAAFAALLAADAMMDTAMNTRALQVQGVYGRSIINSFHGWWSLATIIGSGIGALSAVLDVSLSTFALVIAGISGIAVLVFWRMDSVTIQASTTVPSQTAPESGPNAPRRTVGSVSSSLFSSSLFSSSLLRSGGVLLIVFIMAAVIVEDVPVRWGSIYLADLDQSALIIGLAYLSITTTMTIGRFIGDRMVDRWGGVRVIRFSMALAAAAMTMALLLGGAPAFIIAAAIGGFGVATLFPLAMQAASELPGVSAAMGVAIIAWFSRLGFVIAPLAVGLIAQAASIRAGLAVFVVAAIVLVFVAQAVARPRISR